MEIKRNLARVYHWEYFWLCLLVVATLVMHLLIITHPPEVVFDEYHYVNDARNIIENHESLRPEHPPLAKLIITGGIELFGDNPWGWRFFSVIFGTATIVLFYFLCRRLNMSRTAASIATFLLALENMSFVQASMAMLDVFSVTLMVASFLLYTCRKYIASGVTVGLSALAKLTGALALPTMVIHWLFTRQKRSWWFGLAVLFAPLAIWGLMLLFDSIIVRHLLPLADPVHKVETMWNLCSGLTFDNVTHPALSRPWEWLLSYKYIGYWIAPHYTSAISPTVWALVIPTFGYMIYRAVKKDEAGLFGVAWFASTYLVWIPVSLITDRVSYLYYFYPTIGAICLGLGIGLSRLLALYQQRKTGKLKWTALAIFIVFILAHLASFVILSPVIPINLFT